MASLSQFDTSYDPYQDRLLLRITNTDNDEHRIWFTRRMTLSVLTDFKDKTSAYRISSNPSATGTSAEQLKAQAEFEQQTNVANANLNQEFNSGSHLPLGENGILVYRINFQANINGSSVHALKLLPENGQGITINVTKEILNLIIESFERIVCNTNWLSVPTVQPKASPILQ